MEAHGHGLFKAGVHVPRRVGQRTRRGTFVFLLSVPLGGVSLLFEAEVNVLL